MGDVDEVLHDVDSDMGTVLRKVNIEFEADSVEPGAFGWVIGGVVSPRGHVVHRMAVDFLPCLAYRCGCRGGGSSAAAIYRHLLQYCHPAKTNTKKNALLFTEERGRICYHARGRTKSKPRYSPQSRVLVTRMPEGSSYWP